MRFLLRGFAALLALLLLGLGALWWRLDALAERAIERGASEALGVQTEVESLLLRPISGKLSLQGLRIANPPGYAGAFLVVREARGELDVRTLRSEVIELSELRLDGVEVTLDHERGGSNYDAIVAHLDGPPGARREAARGPAVRVRELFVRNVTAHVRIAPAPAVPLVVPEIQLRNLGGPGGAGTGEITAEVVRAVLTAVATEAPGVPLAVAGRLLGALGLSGAARGLLDVGERGLDAARDALRGILDRSR